jgi:hypothetical protein
MSRASTRDCAFSADLTSAEMSNTFGFEEFAQLGEEI